MVNEPAKYSTEKLYPANTNHLYKNYVAGIFNGFSLDNSGCRCCPLVTNKTAMFVDIVARLHLLLDATLLVTVMLTSLEL